MSLTPQPIFSANSPLALFWSSLVRQLTFFLSNLERQELTSIALVLAGLATTQILQSSFAFKSRIFPWARKIFPLIWRRSLRSMPSFLGNPPIITHRSILSKASSGLSVVISSVTKGKAQSWISRATP